MTAKFIQGKLQVDFHEMLQSLEGEDRLAAIDDLSCNDEIIKHVTDQLLDGWTEGGSSGSSYFPSRADVDRETPLCAARRRIANGANEVAKAEIERLCRTINFYEEAEAKRLKEAQEEFYRRQTI
jgi:hypothetical protein